MKYPHTLVLLFLFILGCISKNTVLNSSNCNDYSFYHNYTNDISLKQINDIPNLKEIDTQSFNSYLEIGNDFEEIKKEQIIFVPEGEFFQKPNLKGDIPLYILGFIQNKNCKHYLAFQLHIGRNSSLFIINQVNNKITSMFSAHSDFNSGFSSENIETKKISDSTFNVKVYHSYDKVDSNGNSSETCHYQLKLSEEGYLSLVE